MKKETGITIGICCIFLFFAGFFYLQREDKAAGSSQEPQQWSDIIASKTPAEGGESEQTLAHQSTECTIYICGAVKSPGVYCFGTDARVCDAVKAAGGFTKKASKSAINQARLLVDGEQITIPKRSRGNPGKKASSFITDTGKNNLVNLNEAGIEELMTLSGIGEVKAQQIISYREQNGRFSSTEEIMKISGIKEGVYNQIKDKITI